MECRGNGEKSAGAQVAFQEAKTAMSNGAANNSRNIKSSSVINAKKRCHALILARLDKRYRERYGMSMVENQKTLKEKGMDEFLKPGRKIHVPKLRRRSLRARRQMLRVRIHTENLSAKLFNDFPNNVHVPSCRFHFQLRL